MKRVILVIVTVAILGTGFYWYARSAPEVKPPVLFEAKKEPFAMKLTELGELRALDSVTISSQTYDAVITDLVPEGTQVKRGEVLVRLDPSKYEADLDFRKAELQVAQADLRKAEQDREAQKQQLLADIARFEAEARLAQLDLNELKRKPLPDEVEKARMELEKATFTFRNAEKKQNLLPKLVEKGFITTKTLENAGLEYLEAKANLQVAQFTLTTVSAGATPQELSRARIILEQAQSALEKAQHSMRSQLQSFEAVVERERARVEQAKTSTNKAMVRLARTVLRASQDGLVVYAMAGKRGSSEKIQLGMIPYRGQPLLELPVLSTMVVDIEVNEIDVGKLKVGGPVEVGLEAYPRAVFHGRILRIASLAKTKQSPSGTASGIKVFEVTVQIEEQDPRLRPGLTATLDFIIDRQEDVISIPLAAVASRGEKHVVFVAHAGGSEERKVVLGTSNDNRVIVKAGLHPGEHVLLDLPVAGIP